MVFKKSLFLFFIIFAFAHPLFGQKQISIVPSVGVMVPFCYAIDDSNADEKFRANTYPVNPSFSITVCYPINDSWKIYTGWRAASDAGTSLAYGDPKKDFRRGRFGTHSYSNRFSLGSDYNLSTVKAFKIKRRVKILESVKETYNKDMLYALLFRFNVIGGASYNRVVRGTGDGELDYFSSGNYIHKVTNDVNFSGFIGFSFQFFNYEKEHFLLRVYYSQGFGQIVRNDVQYSLLSGNYSASLGSRGSFIAAELGYPIRIKLNKSKN